MTLTPEQFDKILTKEEAKQIFVTKDEFNDKMDVVLTAIDGLAKKVDNIAEAFVANQAAHDRFEQRISRAERKLELEPIV